MAANYREFHLPTDGASLVHSTWLEQGERPYLIVPAGVDHFEVEGHLPAGDPRTPKTVVLTFLLNLLMVPLMVIWWVIYTVMLLGTVNRPGYNAGGLFWPHLHPSVIVFGDDRNCLAIQYLNRLNLTGDSGAWVLTDRRFARVGFTPLLDEKAREEGVELHHGIEMALEKSAKLPPEPMGCRSELELPTTQFRFEAGALRQLPRRFKRPRSQRYNRVTFSDGSGLDLRADAAV